MAVKTSHGILTSFVESGILRISSRTEKNMSTPYPAVKPSPTVDDCFKSARFSDYMQWFGATVGTWGYGFIVGKPARFAMAGLMA